MGALSEEDFVRILSETKAGLPEQYAALLGTEGVTLSFTADAIARVARLAAEVGAAWEEILKGKPAQEALKEAKAKADAALERYNRSVAGR